MQYFFPNIAPIDAYRSWLCTIVIQPVFPLQVWPEDELHGSVTDAPHSTVPLPSTKFPVPNDEQGKSTTHSSQLTGSSNSPNLIQSAWSATVRQATSVESRAPWIGGHSRRLNQQHARSVFTSAQQYRLVDVEPCVSWCTRVETLCPYFNPADPTANGGEPAFLCDVINKIISEKNHGQLPTTGKMSVTNRRMPKLQCLFFNIAVITYNSIT
ncbi:hypothetical protein FBUS_00536 [Fasciolopsis buskii]|uniref:Uncharacterized protein n=1 Tax=Fasciolopsis buskii TaxID=27845 RepID=A0A8E0S3Q3_9TREM|nr:hypothetical protein FBUS_00536 [Fasciolopsis buski]